MPNDELLSPCSLYCGSCGIYIATIENNRELKENISVSYKIDINDINCFGCFSENPFKSCKNCPIRNCVRNKNIKGC